MNEYEHKQTSGLLRGIYLSLAVAMGGLGIFLATRLAPAAATGPSVAVCVCLLCFVLFGSLTVRVSRNEVVAAFGIGWIKKSFVAADIVRAAAVRNKWYYGWGIKKVPGGWMYNIYGLDAVEIELHSGRKFRIGTDEPQELLAAIESVITETTPT